MVQYKPVSDHDYQIALDEGGHEGLQLKGTWRPGRRASIVFPVVRCPDCGGLLSLDKNHTIASDGRVAPSIGCPWCGWHVYGTILSWLPSPLPGRPSE
jgi:hypothetical protein